MTNDKVFAMRLAKVYPLLVAKAERKGRTKAEVDTVTGYTPDALAAQIEKDIDYATFFNEAPAIHPNAVLIKGSICGVKVETIDDPLMQNIRRLDKLIDELAKGKAMEKILR
ncbi:MAG: DUF2200 domain-containing protein [Peptococcaceae bacterium]|nr:DUF2200 domain-containing protein [Peptococcaceae bacterium]